MDKRIVSIANHCRSLYFNSTEIVALCHYLDKLNKPCIPAGELSIAFLEEKAMADLHKRFFNDPEPTDVITFPSEPNELDFAGEICIGVDAAVAFSGEHNLPLAQELSRYLVHGWLHIGGYNDGSASARAEMRQVEDALLAKINAAQKQPVFTLTLPASA